MTWTKRPSWSPSTPGAPHEPRASVAALRPRGSWRTPAGLGQLAAGPGGDQRRPGQTGGDHRPVGPGAGRHRQRRIADENTLLVDMAADAGSKAIADAGVSPSDVDTVLVATCTMPNPIPNAAAQVAHRIGVDAPGAFDLNAACAGFCYGMGVASDLIRAGSARTVLVIGAEKISRLARLGRPVDLHHLRRRCRRGRRRRGGDRAGHRLGPWSGAATATCPTRS